MKTGIAVGLAGLIASGMVFAQGPQEEPGPPRGGPPKRGGGPEKRGGGPEKRDFFAEMLRGSDTDKNGSISFTEFAAGGRVKRLPEEAQRRLFDRFDKNADGEIRRDEVPKPKGWGKERGPMSRGPHDLDGDGRVSLEEFRKNPRIAQLEPARQEELFGKLDRNSDGHLDRRDHRGRGAGRDGEGRGPRGPMHGPRMVQELDTDKDGVLSFEEFFNAPRMEGVDEDRAEDMFGHLDRNDDGKLSPEELRGDRRRPGIGPGGPGKGPRGGPGARPERGEGGLEGQGPRPGRPVSPEPRKPAP